MGGTNSKRGRARRWLATAAALAVLGGCSLISTPVVQRHGYVETKDRFARIEPGLPQSAVYDVLGSPSTRSAFPPETWYYISTKTRAVNWELPQPMEREVVAIHFSENGVVAAVDRYDLEDAKEVDVVARKTETRGRSVGFLEQVFGNVGRFPTTGEPGQ